MSQMSGLSSELAEINGKDTSFLKKLEKTPVL
jgi:hypothetical protein